MFVGVWVGVVLTAPALNEALRFPLHVELGRSSVTIVFALRRHTIPYEIIQATRTWEGELPAPFRISGWVLPYYSIYPWSFRDNELGKVRVFGPPPAKTARVVIVPATGKSVLLILQDPAGFSNALAEKLGEVRRRELESAL
jgi:hypothetical protein